MWMNEENGGKGGKAYAGMSKSRNEDHIAAIESDRGGFVPLGFSSIVSTEQKQQLLNWKTPFEPYGLHDFDREGGGAGIRPLSNQGT